MVYWSTDHRLEITLDSINQPVTYLIEDYTVCQTNQRDKYSGNHLSDQVCTWLH